MPPKKVVDKVIEEDGKQEEQKPILVPRVVSHSDMLNLISDKLDLLINGQEEIKKLAKED